MACYGVKGTTYAIYCTYHAEEGMVNVRVYPSDEAAKRRELKSGITLKGPRQISANKRPAAGADGNISPHAESSSLSEDHPYSGSSTVNMTPNDGSAEGFAHPRSASRSPTRTPISDGTDTVTNVHVHSVSPRVAAAASPNGTVVDSTPRRVCRRYFSRASVPGKNANKYKYENVLNSENTVDKRPNKRPRMAMEEEEKEKEDATQAAAATSATEDIAEPSEASVRAPTADLIVDTRANVANAPAGDNNESVSGNGCSAENVPVTGNDADRSLAEGGTTAAVATAAVANDSSPRAVGDRLSSFWAR